MGEEKVTEEQESVSEEIDSLDLLEVIDVQTTLIATLADEIDFSGLYDEAQDDMIKCVSGCFRTIALAQRALQKRIKKEL